MIIRTSSKVIGVLAAFGIALASGWFASVSYRDSNVTNIIVSKLSDLENQFEIGRTNLRVRNPEILRVCFIGDYVYALKDAQRWFAEGDTAFQPALRAAAGGRADFFTGEGGSAIVLLSREAAVILRMDQRTGFSVANFGCANTDAGDIEIWSYENSSSIEFVLPAARLKAPRGTEQARESSCTEALRRFVETIDEFLADEPPSSHYYWAAARKYLPPKGCTSEEVIAVAETSRFFTLAGERGVDASYRVDFKNADTLVTFNLQRDSGEIKYISVRPRNYTPSL